MRCQHAGLDATAHREPGEAGGCRTPWLLEFGTCCPHFWRCSGLPNPPYRLGVQSVASCLARWWALTSRVYVSMLRFHGTQQAICERV